MNPNLVKINCLSHRVLSHIAGFLGYIPKWLKPIRGHRVLLYGQVQSGKSARIISLCRQSPIPTIVVLQNSLMQLQQCCSRFTAEKLPFQVISSDTEYLLAATNPSTVTVVINNTYRLSQLESLWFDELKLLRYAIIVDEADASAKRLCTHPLITRAENETHVTATPFLKFYRSYFHTVEVLNAPKTYVGLAQIQRTFSTDADAGLAGHTSTIDDFMVDDPLCTTKMMLIVTRTVRQEEIIATARHLSQKLAGVPCISLATERILFENGRISRRFNPKLTLSNIIDQFGTAQRALPAQPLPNGESQFVPNGVGARLVLVAHNIATRGLSFVSSDYSRSLTHQIILADANVTPLLQRCRLFGTCSRDTMPILALPTPESLDKADRRVLNFDPAPFLILG